MKIKTKFLKWMVPLVILLGIILIIPSGGLSVVIAVVIAAAITVTLAKQAVLS